jgi:putative RecB family exonuclease
MAKACSNSPAEESNMDISELRKKPHLSASGISDYIECGLRFKFGRVDGIKPEFTSDALVFGSTIHKVLEMFYRGKMEGVKLSLPEILTGFEEHWKKAAEGNSRIHYKEGKSFASIMEEGKSLIATYYHKLPEDDFTVLGIEEPFSFTIPGVPIPFIGVIDLVEEDESGTVIISDFKTSSKAYTVDEVDSSLQLTLYGMAAKANGYQGRDVLLRFDVLVKTKIPKFEQYYSTRCEKDERRATRLIQKVWEGIQKGVFIPNDTSWKCAFCEFKAQCNEWFDTERG